MIRYQLVCDRGHGFESWFRDSSAFDDQAERGLLSCPVCDSIKVQKSLMAPRIGKAASVPAGSVAAGWSPGAPSGSAGQGVPQSSSQSLALVSPEEQALRAKLRELRDHLVANSEHVGRGFAEQARKMHEGEIEHRTIHGEASPDEVKSLVEDGVPVSPLPVLPEDRN